jgi:hypothetical protein
LLCCERLDCFVGCSVVGARREWDLDRGLDVAVGYDCLTFGTFVVVVAREV